MKYVMTYQTGGWIASLTVLLVSSTVMAEEDATLRVVPLLDDTQFQRGLTLWKPATGQKVPCGVLRSFQPDAEPVWGMAQWSSKHSLEGVAAQRLPSGAIRYANAGRSVIFGPPGSHQADLRMAVNASQEYGDNLRKKGEPWPHMLIERKLLEHPSVTDLKELNYAIDFRLLRSKEYRGPEWTNRLHAAQFLAFLTVQNRNPDSKGFGDFLWFGMPMYDSRHPQPGAHAALDSATGKFIYTPAGSRYTEGLPKSGEWVSIRRDLLPLIREGLEKAWSQDFLPNSRDLADYEVRAINLGWEVPGTLDVETQIRNLSLEAVLPR